MSAQILDAAIEVHRCLGGPGLLESVYEEALALELHDRGLTVRRQLELPINYKGRRLRTALRVDMLVDECVLVECKAVEKYNTIAEVQTLTYLRLANLKLGLVLNFGERLISRGTRRVLNGFA